MRPAGGHRVVPHTADVVLEAWAPTREACLAQAVQALAASFVDARGAPTRPVPFTVRPDTDDELLVRLLDEVVFLVDARDLLPLTADVAAASDGGLTGTFAAAPIETVEVVGAPPKAVAHHGVLLERRRDHWFARVTIDV